MAGVTLALAVWACLAPTEITLRLETDIACATVAARGGADIIGGPLGQAATANTSTCSDGPSPHALGSLVVTPSGSKSGRVQLSIVLGVDRPTAQCTASDLTGCILARRSLAFVAHKPLELPVRLSRACIGVVCPDGTTCVDGRCSTDDVDDAKFCVGGPDCGTPAPTTADGGLDASSIVDAGSSDAGPTMVATLRAATPRARGLTLHPPALGAIGPTFLLWTTSDADGGTTVYAAPLGADAGALTSYARLITLPGEGYGIGTDSKVIVVAGQLGVPSSCAMRFDISGPPAASIPCDTPSTKGVDHATNPTDAFIASGPNGLLRSITPPIFGAISGSPSGGGYLEIDRLAQPNDVYFALPDALGRWSSVATSPPPIPVPGIVGVAVGSGGRVHVTGTTAADAGFVATVNTATRSRVDLPVSIPHPQDAVLWRNADGSGDLFVAAEDGVYQIAGVE